MVPVSLSPSSLEGGVADRGLGDRVIAHLPTLERARQLAVLELKFHRTLSGWIVAATGLGPFPRAGGRSVSRNGGDGDKTSSAKRREELQGGFHGYVLGMVSNRWT